VYHNNEYGFETFYTLQLTPTSQLRSVTDPESISGEGM